MAITKTNNRMIDGSVVNVLDYGAYNDGTNATATRTAIQNALNSGGKMVYVPAGTYKLDSNLSVPQGVSIKGDGQGSTIFDASTIDYTTLPAGSSIIEVAEITPTAIPDLASDASINDKEITLASAPSVEVGDIILIYNPNPEINATALVSGVEYVISDTGTTDFTLIGASSNAVHTSFTATGAGTGTGKAVLASKLWNSTRAYYRAGEYLKVSAVSGSTLRFEGSIVDNYAVADVDLYKMDMGYCSMTGFTIKCKADAQSTATGGLTLNHCKHSVVRDVEVITAPYVGIVFSRCFDVTADNCRASDNFTDDASGEYGLAVWNSTYVTVKDCHLCSERHGLTTGGGDGIGQVTSRFLNYVNNHVSTEGNAQALDVHGNAEYVNISNNVVDGGITFGGDYINISNNNLMGKTVNGSAIYFTDLKGFHLSITGNTVKSDFQDSGRGNLIDCGGNSTPYSANSDRGGVLQISDNTLIYDAPVDTSDVEYAVIVVANQGYNGSEDASVSVQNNTLSVVNAPSDPNFFVDDYVSVKTVSGNPWQLVSIDNNTGSGGLVISASTTHSANNVSITNNTIKDGYQVSAIDVKNVCTIVGNSFESIQFYAGSIGDSSNPTDTVRISDNVFKDCFWARTSSSSNNTVLLCTNGTNVYVANNFITGANEKLRTTGLPSSPAFELGETITGGTSGVTAVVYDTSEEYLLIKDSASGTFFTNGITGETITGGTSGATATLHDTSPQVSTKNYSRSFITITNLYTGANADTELSTEYKSAIGNDVAL
jgi:hypothetical protein